MKTLVIKNGTLVNEGKCEQADLVIADGMIADILPRALGIYDHEIDARGKYVMPGVIDDQVHFREPGLTHKAEIFTESKAAVAGGITSWMEMPNTVPNTLTQELLEEKYRRAAEVSMGNFSFFMGAANDNLEEVLKTDAGNVCGVKVFMGSSTGNMLVDNTETLEALFEKCPMLIATHCEDETTICQNLEAYRKKYGDNITIEMHPEIRSEKACYLSSSKATELARKHGTRLHILHISTTIETHLFRNDIPLREKRITSEACVHHLWFSNEDYKHKGNFIKWNPAVKSVSDRAEVWKALLDNRIDIVATDHAPHTLEEKSQPYLQAPSGGPLVQHALPAMMECVKQGKITVERLVEKMCHAPAECFRLQKRGYLRPGYFADVVIFDPEAAFTVTPDNILYKCGWSPFENVTFSGSVQATLVNGEIAWYAGEFNQNVRGRRLTFEKNRK